MFLFLVRQCETVERKEILIFPRIIALTMNTERKIRVIEETEIRTSLKLICVHWARAKEKKIIILENEILFDWFQGISNVKQYVFLCF